jgi:intracellular multiplication protein IcmL
MAKPPLPLPNKRSVQNLGAKPSRPEGMRTAPAQNMDGHAAPAQLETDSLYTVITRNKFYREGYHSLLKVALVQVVVIFVLAAMVGYKVFIEPEHVRYFATTDDGRIIDPNLLSLNNPNLRDSAVLTWATQAAADIMTFNWEDYQLRLQASNSYFTQSGWEGFKKALGDSRLLEGMKANQQLITTVPFKAPVITDQGSVNDRYYWHIQLPVITSTISGDKKASKTQLLNLTVVRVSPLQNPSALGIEQWVQTDCGDACH